MPDPKYYFEDFEPGSEVTFGDYAVTAEEIITYAAEFDPQPMHLDDTAARETMLGGLAASGWHTCAMLMRVLCDGFLLESAGWGSPGIESVKWLRPVRPGDRLSCTRTVLDAKVSRSRPEMGVVRFRFEVKNQAGETVMTMENPIMFGLRRPEAGA